MHRMQAHVDFSPPGVMVVAESSTKPASLPSAATPTMMRVVGGTPLSRPTPTPTPPTAPTHDAPISPATPRRIGSAAARQYRHQQQRQQRQSFGGDEGGANSLLLAHVRSARSPPAPLSSSSSKPGRTSSAASVTSPSLTSAALTPATAGATAKKDALAEAAVPRKLRELPPALREVFDELLHGRAHGVSWEQQQKAEANAATTIAEEEGEEGEDETTTTAVTSSSAAFAAAAVSPRSTRAASSEHATVPAVLSSPSFKKIPFSIAAPRPQSFAHNRSSSSFSSSLTRQSLLQKRLEVLSLAESGAVTISSDPSAQRLGLAPRVVRDIPSAEQMRIEALARKAAEKARAAEALKARQAATVAAIEAARRNRIAKRKAAAAAYGSPNGFNSSSASRRPSASIAPGGAIHPPGSGAVSGTGSRSESGPPSPGLTKVSASAANPPSQLDVLRAELQRQNALNAAEEVSLAAQLARASRTDAERDADEAAARVAAAAALVPPPAPLPLVPFSLQGDLDLYSTANLERRAANKFETSFLDAVQNMWASILDEDHGQGHEDPDQEEDQAKPREPTDRLAPRAAFVRMLVLMYDHLHNEEDAAGDGEDGAGEAGLRSPSRTPSAVTPSPERLAALHASLSQDLCTDLSPSSSSPSSSSTAASSSSPSVSFAQFHDAVFQIADNWTLGVDLHEYVSFIRAMTVAVTRPMTDLEIKRENERHRRHHRHNDSSNGGRSTSGDNNNSSSARSSLSLSASASASRRSSSTDLLPVSPRRWKVALDGSSVVVEGSDEDTADNSHHNNNNRLSLTVQSNQPSESPTPTTLLSPALSSQVSSDTLELATYSADEGEDGDEENDSEARYRRRTAMRIQEPALASRLVLRASKLSDLLLPSPRLLSPRSPRARSSNGGGGGDSDSDVSADPSRASSRLSFSSSSYAADNAPPDLALAAANFSRLSRVGLANAAEAANEARRATRAASKIKQLEAILAASSASTAAAAAEKKAGSGESKEGGEEDSESDDRHHHHRAGGAHLNSRREAAAEQQLDDSAATGDSSRLTSSSLPHGISVEISHRSNRPAALSPSAAGGVGDDSTPRRGLVDFDPLHVSTHLQVGPDGEITQGRMSPLRALLQSRKRQQQFSPQSSPRATGAAAAAAAASDDSSSSPPLPSRPLAVPTTSFSPASVLRRLVPKGPFVAGPGVGQERRQAALDELRSQLVAQAHLEELQKPQQQQRNNVTIKLGTSQALVRKKEPWELEAEHEALRNIVANANANAAEVAAALRHAQALSSVQAMSALHAQIAQSDDTPPMAPPPLQSGQNHHPAALTVRPLATVPRSRPAASASAAVTVAGSSIPSLPPPTATRKVLQPFLDFAPQPSSPLEAPSASSSARTSSSSTKDDFSSASPASAQSLSYTSRWEAERARKLEQQQQQQQQLESPVNSSADRALFRNCMFVPPSRRPVTRPSPPEREIEQEEEKQDMEATAPQAGSLASQLRTHAPAGIIRLLLDSSTALVNRASRFQIYQKPSQLRPSTSPSVSAMGSFASPSSFSSTARAHGGGGGVAGKGRHGGKPLVVAHVAAHAHGPPCSTLDLTQALEEQMAREAVLASERAEQTSTYLTSPPSGSQSARRPGTAPVPHVLHHRHHGHPTPSSSRPPFDPTSSTTTTPSSLSPSIVGIGHGAQSVSGGGLLSWRPRPNTSLAAPARLRDLEHVVGKHAMATTASAAAALMTPSPPSSSHPPLTLSDALDSSRRPTTVPTAANDSPNLSLCLKAQGWLPAPHAHGKPFNEGRPASSGRT